MQVIDDSFELAQTDRLKYAVPLGLVNSLHLEEEYQPWRVALSALSRIDNLLRTDAHYHVFRVSGGRSEGGRGKGGSDWRRHLCGERALVHKKNVGLPADGCEAERLWIVG